MPALTIHVTVPFGDAGTVGLAIDIADLGQVTLEQRAALAATSRDFVEFAAAALEETPNLDLSGVDYEARGSAGPGPGAAEIHDPDAGVLAGVTGDRRNKT